MIGFHEAMVFDFDELLENHIFQHGHIADTCCLKGLLSPTAPLCG